MAIRAFMTTFLGVLVAVVGMAANAASDECSNGTTPSIAFVQLQSLNLAGATPLTIEGKLSLPGGSGDRLRCVPERQDWPAVLILHCSAGVDSGGDFHEEALNKAGIATLQIDMWEARGVTGIANRPQAPILTYPDAFRKRASLRQVAQILRERSNGREGLPGLSRRPGLRRDDVGRVRRRSRGRLRILTSARSEQQCSIKLDHIPFKDEPTLYGHCVARGPDRPRSNRGARLPNHPGTWLAA